MRVPFWGTRFFELLKPGHQKRITLGSRGINSKASTKPYRGATQKHGKHMANTQQGKVIQKTENIRIVVHVFLFNLKNKVQVSVLDQTEPTGVLTRNTHTHTHIIYHTRMDTVDTNMPQLGLGLSTSIRISFIHLKVCFSRLPFSRLCFQSPQ